MLYFAYGSNMRTARLRTRAPSARVVGVARLVGHELRFHKRARDGSAKCDAVATGRGEDAVHGVVFDLDGADWEALDRAEGRGAGYERRVVLVEPVLAGEVEAYLAQEEYVTDSLLPYSWYRDLVVAGAREHGLPAEYIARLAAQAVMEDADVERAARERGFL